MVQLNRYRYFKFIKTVADAAVFSYVAKVLFETSAEIDLLLKIRVKTRYNIAQPKQVF